MTVIDINSGKFTGKNELEETIFQINLEAAHEIPRQLRLRGIGGIVLMDFIDMKDKAQREEIIRVLNQELQKDKVHSRVLGITKLGLVEMTRKKTRASMGTALAWDCPACAGKGRTLSNKVIAHEVMRKLSAMEHRRTGTIKVEVSSQLMSYFDMVPIDLEYIKNKLGKEIVFSVNPELTEPYQILP
jgi:ribonuclease G